MPERDCIGALRASWLAFVGAFSLTSKGQGKLPHMLPAEEALVSIVIPCFRRQTMLRRAVHSAIAQTHSNLEIIVVDDASPQPLVNPFPADDRVLMIRRDENGGVAAAQNTGLDQAAGECVLFLHSDDELTETAVESHIEQFVQSGSVAGVEGAATVVRSGETQRYVRPRLRDSGVDDLLRFRFGVHISQFLFRTTVAKQVRFNELLRGWEDWDFLLRTLAKGHRFSYHEAPVVIIHDHLADRLSSLNVQVEALETLRETYKADVERAEIGELWAFKIGKMHARLKDWPRARREFTSLRRYGPLRPPWQMLSRLASLPDRQFAFVWQLYETIASAKRTLTHSREVEN